MTENNLLYGAAGAVAVWWWLHRRKCSCPGEGQQPVAAQPAPAPPAAMPPSVMDTRPMYLPPNCPEGFEVGEGGSCYKTTMRSVPGYPTLIPYTDVVAPSCPAGYDRQSTSGSCMRS